MATDNLFDASNLKNRIPYTNPTLGFRTEMQRGNKYGWPYNMPSDQSASLTAEEPTVPDLSTITPLQARNYYSTPEGNVATEMTASGGPVLSKVRPNLVPGEDYMMPNRTSILDRESAERKRLAAQEQADSSPPIYQQVIGGIGKLMELVGESGVFDKSRKRAPQDYTGKLLTTLGGKALQATAAGLDVARQQRVAKREEERKFGEKYILDINDPRHPYNALMSTLSSSMPQGIASAIPTSLSGVLPQEMASTIPTSLSGVLPQEMALTIPTSPNVTGTKTVAGKPPEAPPMAQFYRDQSVLSGDVNALADINREAAGMWDLSGLMTKIRYPGTPEEQNSALKQLSEYNSILRSTQHPLLDNQDRFTQQQMDDLTTAYYGPSKALAERQHIESQTRHEDAQTKVQNAMVDYQNAQTEDKRIEAANRLKDLFSFMSPIEAGIALKNPGLKAVISGQPILTTIAGVGGIDAAKTREAEENRKVTTEKLNIFDKAMTHLGQLLEMELKRSGVDAKTQVSWQKQLNDADQEVNRRVNQLKASMMPVTNEQLISVRNNVYGERGINILYNRMRQLSVANGNPDPVQNLKNQSSGLDPELKQLYQKGIDSMFALSGPQTGGQRTFGSNQTANVTIDGQVHPVNVGGMTDREAAAEINRLRTSLSGTPRVTQQVTPQANPADIAQPLIYHYQGKNLEENQFTAEMQKLGIPYNDVRQAAIEATHSIASRPGVTERQVRLSIPVRTIAILNQRYPGRIPGQYVPLEESSPLSTFGRGEITTATGGLYAPGASQQGSILDAIRHPSNLIPYNMDNLFYALGLTTGAMPIGKVLSLPALAYKYGASALSKLGGLRSLLPILKMGAPAAQALATSAAGIANYLLNQRQGTSSGVQTTTQTEEEKARNLHDQLLALELQGKATPAQKNVRLSLERAFDLVERARNNSTTPQPMGGGEVGPP